ncbi:MAG: HAMP domain-containing sensor histidine kinase [Nitrososphaeraceae archaeon]
MSSKNRIREIQEGRESEFLEVIQDAQKARDIYVDLARSIDNEGLLLFANSMAMVRADRLGIVDYLIRASNKEASIKIICPITEENIQIIKKISEKAPCIRILNGGNSQSGLFIVNNAEFIRFEIKEVLAEDFTEAVGFVIYSNTKVSVYSSRSFFELLWNERLQYEKLKEADEMKSEVINLLAHELRTPIQPILSMIDIIRSDMKDTNQKELLDTILRNAKRLQRLTDNILDVSKIERGSLDLRQECFNLKDVITNNLDDTIVLRNNLSNNINERTSVRVYYQPQDSFVEGDKDRISQVVYNLLNNAFKFSKDGSNITVNSKVEDSKIVVSVKDTGQGIDPEILPKLFSKFEAKSFSGSGLGLYICKNIIEAHGGKMWAQNNNIINGESGATFYFSLPVLNVHQNYLVR